MSQIVEPTEKYCGCHWAATGDLVCPKQKQQPARRLEPTLHANLFPPDASSCSVAQPTPWAPADMDVSTDGTPFDIRARRTTAADCPFCHSADSIPKAAG